MSPAVANVLRPSNLFELQLLYCCSLVLARSKALQPNKPQACAQSSTTLTEMITILEETSTCAWTGRLVRSRWRLRKLRTKLGPVSKAFAFRRLHTTIYCCCVFCCWDRSLFISLPKTLHISKHCYSSLGMSGFPLMVSRNCSERSWPGVNWFPVGIAGCAAGRPK